LLGKLGFFVPPEEHLMPGRRLPSGEAGLVRRFLPRIDVRELLITFPWNPKRVGSMVVSFESLLRLIMGLGEGRVSVREKRVDVS
jgi:hypothetical protein